MYSPWGKVDNITTYGRGLAFVNTPSHGGFRVSRKLFFSECINADEVLVLAGIDYGNYIYFEEDCAWALFLTESPSLLIQYSNITCKDQDKVFTDALAISRRWYPHFYEVQK